MKKELVLELYNIGAIKFGEFTLKSGVISPIYIDLRMIVSYPQLLRDVANAYCKMIKDLQFDVICGVPYTALPIATAISLNLNIPMLMRRKEAKDYGTKKIIEGVFTTGQSCLIIEDLITSGLSSLETIEPLETNGLKVTDIAVLLDREQGGAKVLQNKGYTLHSVLNITELLDILKTANKLDESMVNKVQSFIFANQN